jgi:hypothetical protein
MAKKIASRSRLEVVDVEPDIDEIVIHDHVLKDLGVAIRREGLEYFKNCNRRQSEST